MATGGRNLHGLVIPHDIQSFHEILSPGLVDYALWQLCQGFIGGLDNGVETGKTFGKESALFFLSCDTSIFFHQFAANDFDDVIDGSISVCRDADVTLLVIFKYLFHEVIACFGNQGDIGDHRILGS